MVPRFIENFRHALVNLRDQRQRAWLSALGIAVASVAIVTLVSIALGVRGDLTKQVESLGVNTVIVLPGRFKPGEFNPNIGGQSFLKDKHAAAVRDIPGVVRACPLTFAGGGLSYNKKDAYPTIIATTSDWFAMVPQKLTAGKLWTDPLTRDMVAVIGSVAAGEIFGKTVSPLGKKVTINTREYTIIGVTADSKSEGGSLFSMFSIQNVVYIPYHAVHSVTPDMQTDRVMIQSRPDADPKLLVPALESRLGQFLSYQQYSVLTQEDLLGLVYRLMRILTWLLVGLTSIALFVGGVGIMTVMLMSVNERTREIGIRKTVGATRADVFQQFLAESVVLSLLGGTAGLLFSYGICAGLYRYTDIKPTVTWGVVALCFGTCFFVGGVFGLIPAVRASRLEPVAAMRQE